MSQLILVVTEPWHSLPHERIVKRGEIIFDPAHINEILDTRPGNVIKRQSLPHEDELIEKAKAAGEPDVVPETESAE